MKSVGAAQPDAPWLEGAPIRLTTGMPEPGYASSQSAPNDVWLVCGFRKSSVSSGPASSGALTFHT